MVSKVQERIFTEEAANLLNAQWKIIDISEPPDFEIHSGDEVFGLEVRQIFVDDERSYGSPIKRNESKQQRILRNIAQRYYDAGGEPIHVKVSGTLSDGNVDVVVQELMRCRPPYTDSTSLLEDTNIYIENTKFLLKPLPASFSRYSRWVRINDHVGWVRNIQASDLQSAVDKKGAKLKVYKDKYAKVILLLVADRRYRSGMLGGTVSFRLNNPGFHTIYFMSRLEFIEYVG